MSSIFSHSSGLYLSPKISSEVSSNHESEPFSLNLENIFSLIFLSLRISPVFLFKNIAKGTPHALWRETTQSGLLSTIDLILFFPLVGIH